MKKIIYLALILAFPFSGTGQSFGRFLDRINSLPVDNRQAVADSFMKSVKSFPFIESDTLVHFIYRGSAKSVTLAGDMTGWLPNIELREIDGTNLWHHSGTYESNARLDYKFLMNGVEWILDPVNPYTCIGGFGPNSELRMPAYSDTQETKKDKSVPHGTIIDTTIFSAHMGVKREILVYLPPDYKRTSKKYPLVLFHDGKDYLEYGATQNILDNLIAQNQIEPIIAVFVPPVDRPEEYTGKLMNAYCKFIIAEVLPMVDRKYATSKDPRKRATIGPSAGGNIALYLGLKYPSSFGKVIAQSSAIRKPVFKACSKARHMELEFYLDIGKYDLPMVIPEVREFTALLKAKKYLFTSWEWNEGHSWGNWKGHLKVPLMKFFPAK
jgi:enterochelin esterase-like enzyme